MSYCSKCGQPIEKGMNYCPRCGSKLSTHLKDNLTPYQYYHKIIHFVYDAVRPFYEKDHLQGFIVSRDSKEGFLRKTSWGLSYLSCSYDKVIPVFNQATFTDGKAPGGLLYFIVKRNGKYGIVGPDGHFRGVGHPQELFVPIKYDSIKDIPGLPNIVIVRSGNGCSFYQLSRGRVFEKEYKDIFKVRPKDNKYYPDGEYYACVPSWREITSKLIFTSEPQYTYFEGKAEIYDVFKLELVDTVFFKKRAGRVESNSWAIVYYY